MCSITMALAGLSTGLQMYGQQQQTKAAVASANAQAQAAEKGGQIKIRRHASIIEGHILPDKSPRRRKRGR